MDLTIIVAVVTGLTQILKQYIPNMYTPAVALLLGVVGGVLYIEDSLKIRLLIGLAIGLASMGVFDIGKMVFKKQ
jgi:hypothetical protein